MVIGPLDGLRDRGFLFELPLELWRDTVISVQKMNAQWESIHLARSSSNSRYSSSSTNTSKSSYSCNISSNNSCSSSKSSSSSSGSGSSTNSSSIDNDSDSSSNSSTRKRTWSLPPADEAQLHQLRGSNSMELKMSPLGDLKITPVSSSCQSFLFSFSSGVLLLQPPRWWRREEVSGGSGCPTRQLWHNQHRGRTWWIVGLPRLC